MNAFSNTSFFIIFSRSTNQIKLKLIAVIPYQLPESKKIKQQFLIDF